MQIAGLVLAVAAYTNTVSKKLPYNISLESTHSHERLDLHEYHADKIIHDHKIILNSSLLGSSALEERPGLFRIAL